MRKEIATGIQDFEKLRVNDCFYVDKTDFIRRWWNGKDEVTLITRPRRFGKTLNMSMMNCFFSLKYANRGDLFEGTRVWEDEAFHSLQGTFPVIFLSFAGVKQKTFQETRRSLNLIIANLYNEYHWMLQDDRFTRMDREFYDRVGADMDSTVAAISLNRLCAWLERYYGKKVLIFLDEYDTPMQEAYLLGFWGELTGYIRALFNNTFKTNPSLDRAILTGITRVSRESIFSDLNNLVVVTTTSIKYATCFGFTEEETFRAMEEQGLGAWKEDAKRWYDGFTFGGVTDIYNPWSITNFLDNGQLKPYWANSSGNGLVGSLIRQGDQGIKTKFETLLKGGIIEVPVDEEIVFHQLSENPDAIWSLLLASGYLKVEYVPKMEEYSASREIPTYRLSLTNLEVRVMFRNMVKGWFSQGGGMNGFMSAMFRGDPEEMTDYLNSIMEKTMSFFDAGGTGKTEPERFYHGLVLGLLVEKENYLLKSNRESGYGRYDVIMEPLDDQDPAVILEFKTLNPRRGENTLEETAENALRQIEEKGYDAELLERGIPAERIRKYGLAFRGKECLIVRA